MNFKSEWHREADAKSERIFDFIIKYKTAHDGNGPTYARIMGNCDISSEAVVYFHLRRLADQGLIAIVNRRIEVTGGRWVAPEEGS